ncbi:hypothetical protein PR202_ga31126 [Eleusine coracana subsp. coracana]|uniref:F-box domain-containing protein n=1 Tax=Eleusine coracana subsp. coracana TaxID=191504 RepID=A0AAV5DQN7_ELECO|nr:hypothetical protein PR202_ga31126 [Eleusine coracana subsp. coracana]
MAAFVDRLSSLPDEILHHVLSHTQAKEAAASSVLSRRWRTLWLQAGVLNLDTRRFGTADDSYDAFVRGANAALAPFRGAGGPVLRRVTIFMGRSCRRNRYSYNNDSDDDDDRDDLVNAILADPATARLEELHVDYEDNMMFSNAGSTVRLAFLRCAATLRTLELSNCGVKACGGGLGFPRLSSLVLRNCVLPEGYLQDVVDAAPALSSLRLQDVRHEPVPTETEKEERKKRYCWERKCYLLRFGLRCPTLTELVLVACGTVRKKEAALSYSGIELDVPNLQSFSYRGRSVRLALTLPMPNLARVDIDDSGRSGYGRDRYRCSYSYGDDEDRGPKKLVPLSSMIESFRCWRYAQETIRI